MYKLFSRFQIAYQNYKNVRSFTRVVLIAFSVGLASLYVMLYVVQSFQQEKARRFPSQGQNLYSIIKTAPRGILGSNQLRPLGTREVKVLKRESELITYATPEARLNTMLREGGLTSTVPLAGVAPDYQNVHGLAVSAGRFITELDSARMTCVLGQTLYQRLKSESPDLGVGFSIVLGGQVYSIAGILMPSTGEAGEYGIDETVLIHFATLQQFLKHPEITKVTLRSDTQTSVETVKAAISSMLTSLLGDIELYEISNQQDFLRRVYTRLKFFSIFLGTLGSVCLVVGAWTLLKLMMITMIDRRNIIEVVQVLGVDRNSAYYQFILESILLSLLGWLGGSILGGVASLIIAYTYEWSPFLSLAGLFSSLAAALSLGIICGAYPVVHTHPGLVRMLTVKSQDAG